MTPPSSKLSPRRHNPRPPSICISKKKPRPTTPTPPPPPPIWPPDQITLNIDWYDPPTSTRISATLKLTPYDEMDTTITYYYDDAQWLASIVLDTARNHWFLQTTRYQNGDTYETDYLQFTLTEEGPFEVTVLDYPYKMPSTLTVHDSYTYP